VTGVGSPAINRGISFSISGILEMIKSLSFRDKKVATFGAYGWSGEGVRIINGELKDAGFEVIDEGIRTLWNPNEQELERCRDFGQRFVRNL